MSLRTVVLMLAGLAAPATAQLSTQMSAGVPGARLVPAYSTAERAEAARKALKIPLELATDATVSVTPNAPYANDGTRINAWKPSFLLGTASGGEIGVNFWGVHIDGHVNILLPPAPNTSRLLDCRILSTGPITYKIFRGADANNSTGERALENGHEFVLLSALATSEPALVEFWPTPTTVVMGFLGCEISAVR